MERMGFGLAVASKVMDAIIKWVIRGFTDVDNYVDDLRVPPNRALSNDISDVVVRRRKVALHTISHLTPTEA